jgi:type III restriction enzyme
MGYHPDFLVKLPDRMYVVETKAQNDIRNENVLQKERGALDWIKHVNECQAEDRDNREWVYVILDENTFYSLRDRGASIQEILEYGKLTRQVVERELF